LDDLLTAFLLEDFPLPRPDIVAGINRCCFKNKEFKNKQGGGAAGFIVGKMIKV